MAELQKLPFCWHILFYYSNEGLELYLPTDSLGETRIVKSDSPVGVTSVKGKPYSIRILVKYQTYQSRTL